MTRCYSKLAILLNTTITLHNVTWILKYHLTKYPTLMYCHMLQKWIHHSTTKDSERDKDMAASVCALHQEICMGFITIFGGDTCEIGVWGPPTKQCWASDSDILVTSYSPVCAISASNYGVKVSYFLKINVLCYLHVFSEGHHHVVNTEGNVPPASPLKSTPLAGGATNRKPLASSNSGVITWMKQRRRKECDI